MGADVIINNSKVNLFDEIMKLTDNFGVGR